MIMKVVEDLFARNPIGHTPAQLLHPTPVCPVLASMLYIILTECSFAKATEAAWLLPFLLP